MNDFITLSCPTCGGELIVDKNAEFFTCKYCKQKQIIRPEDKEFHAKCPICKRNDKVEKVTAIYNSNDLSRRRFAPPTHPDDQLFYNPNPKPELISKPVTLQKPVETYKRYNPLVVWGIILITLIPTVICGLQLNNDFSIIKLILSILGLLFLALSVRYLDIVQKKYKAGKAEWEQKLQAYNENQLMMEDWQEQSRKTQNAQEEWEIYKKDYDQRYNEEKAVLMRDYQGKMERFNQLYYCHRDDCVFIPGENGITTPEHLEKIVNNSPDRNN